MISIRSTRSFLATASGCIALLVPSVAQEHQGWPTAADVIAAIGDIDADGVPDLVAGQIGNGAKV